MKIRHTITTVSLILSGCGDGLKEERPPTLDIVLDLNSSFMDYVRCDLNGCDYLNPQSRSIIPPFQSIFFTADASDFYAFRMKDLPFDTCVDQPRTGDKNPVKRVQMEDETCAVSLSISNMAGKRQFERTLNSFSAGDANFTFLGGVEPLSRFSFHVDPIKKTECKRKVQVGEKEFTVIIKKMSLDFPTLFNFQPTIEQLQVKSAPKGKPFTFRYIPAVNTAAWTKEGQSDEEVKATLSKQLGDFLLMKLEDQFGITKVCKFRDAIEGKLVVPADVVNALDRKTRISVVRYKVIGLESSDDVRIGVSLRTKMYQTGNDATGFDDYKVSFE